MAALGLGKTFGWRGRRLAVVSATLVVITLIFNEALGITEASASDSTPAPAGMGGTDVPIYSVCWAGDQTGYYQWEIDASGNFSNYIDINDCALQRMGAGPQDRQRVIAHEMGHANGLPHSSDPSNIMYPVIPIYGT